MWDKKYNKTADMIVVEGPKAGGHLGFHRNDLKDIDSIDYESYGNPWLFIFIDSL